MIEGQSEISSQPESVVPPISEIPGTEPWKREDSKRDPMLFFDREDMKITTLEDAGSLEIKLQHNFNRIQDILEVQLFGDVSLSDAKKRIDELDEGQFLELHNLFGSADSIIEQLRLIVQRIEEKRKFASDERELATRIKELYNTTINLHTDEPTTFTALERLVQERFDREHA